MSKNLRLGPQSIQQGPKGPLKGSGDSAFQTVRVRDIVLGPDHPRFEEVGGWLGLGTIIFSSVKSPGLKGSSKSSKLAKPYFSNSKFYPLINELVTIVKSTEFIESQGSLDYGANAFYYFPTVGGWNNTNHNALPDPLAGGNVLTSPNKSYEEVDNGMVNRDHVSTNKLYLGNTFEEKSRLKGLYPYEGDHILEGRFGNSLRFGSTVNSRVFPNTWSSEGDKGDPIIILRNGPEPESSPAYIPTVENISDDKASIYLTSTQKLPFFASSFNTDSFGKNDTTPISPSEYQGSQILLTSGRLILNAKSDGVLISSPNIIHLSAGDSIHFDCAKKMVLSTGEVDLVDRNATEREVLGNQLVRELREYLVVMDSLSIALNSALDSTGAEIDSLHRVGPRLGAAVSDFRRAIEGDNPTILSNVVKLK